MFILNSFIGSYFQNHIAEKHTISYGQYVPFWSSVNYLIKSYQNDDFGEKSIVHVTGKLVHFVEISFPNLPFGSLEAPVCLEAPCRDFAPEKLQVLRI